MAVDYSISMERLLRHFDESGIAHMGLVLYSKEEPNQPSRYFANKQVVLTMKMEDTGACSLSHSRWQASQPSPVTSFFMGFCFALLWASLALLCFCLIPRGYRLLVSGPLFRNRDSLSSIQEVFKRGPVDCANVMGSFGS